MISPPAYTQPLHQQENICTFADKLKKSKPYDNNRIHHPDCIRTTRPVRHAQVRRLFPDFVTFFLRDNC